MRIEATAAKFTPLTPGKGRPVNQQILQPYQAERNKQWIAAQKCARQGRPSGEIPPPQTLTVSCAKCGSTVFYFQGLCRHTSIKCLAKRKVSDPSVNAEL